MARNETEAAAVILVLLTARSLRKRRAKEAKKKPRFVWVKPWIANQQIIKAFPARYNKRMLKVKSIKGLKSLENKVFKIIYNLTL